MFFKRNKILYFKTVRVFYCHSQLLRLATTIEGIIAQQFPPKQDKFARLLDEVKLCDEKVTLHDSCKLT
jgi:hypothetical protein